MTSAALRCCFEFRREKSRQANDVFDQTVRELVQFCPHCPKSIGDLVDARAIAGSLAGSVVTGKWEGLGRWTSLGIGLVGALIGGAIFRLIGIWPGLEAFSISLRDVVAAIIGSLIFLAVLWFVRNRRTG